MPTEWETKREIVEVCRRMYERGYIVASEGNVSVRAGPSRIVATPSGLPKGLLTPDQLVVVDPNGNRISGRNRPSSEILLHLKIYELRPDVRAVVHAHPPAAIAYTVAGIPIPEDVLPEVVVNLGAIVTAPYATPASPDGAEAIARLIPDHDAIILDHHGSVTVGANLNDAYMKLETVEHSAFILFLAHTLGQVGPLPEEEVAKLAALGEASRSRAKDQPDGGWKQRRRIYLSSGHQAEKGARRPPPPKPPRDGQDGKRAGHSDEAVFEAIYAAVVEELARISHQRS